MSRSPQCPREAVVLAHFLDGDQSVRDASIVSHLEDCPSCARAVEQSRKLDALLAAQTQTEISDDKANDLLAFLRAPGPASADADGLQVEPVAVNRGFRRALATATWLGLAAAAAVLALVWWLDRGRPADPVRESRAAQNTVVVNAPAETPKSSIGYRLPDGARFTMSSQKLGRSVREFGDDELVAAFAGRWVSGLDRARLLHEARRLLRGKPAGASLSALRLDTLRDAVRSSAAIAVGPRRLSSEERLIVAATGWLLGELRSRRTERATIRVLADGILASRGRLRNELVTLARRDRDSLRDGPLALLAAIGDASSNRRLARRPYTEIRNAALASLRTGDAESVRCLLDLYLEVASRSPALGEISRTWFEALDRSQLRDLGRTLADRARASPRRAHKDLCEQLMLRLGLLATSNP